MESPWKLGELLQTVPAPLTIPVIEPLTIHGKLPFVRAHTSFQLLLQRTPQIELPGAKPAITIICNRDP